MTHPRTTEAIESFLNSDLGQATIRKGYTDVVQQILEAFVAGIDVRRWRLDPSDYGTRMVNAVLGHFDRAGYLQGLRVRTVRDDPELWAVVRAIVETEITARHASRTAGLAQQDCDDLRERD